MRAKTIKNSEVMVLALQDEIRRSPDSRYDHRLHGVLLIAQGMSAPEVARLLGDSPRTVEYWVERFERDGLGGLTDGEREGRPKRLDEKQMQEIGRVFRSTPEEVGLRGNIWDGKTLATFIETRFKVELGVRQCQRLFRTLDFRLRKPRSLIAKSDPLVQLRHKKTPKANA
jgi:transposase